MFSIKFGRVFEVSSHFGDFLVRFGRMEFYWSRDTGFICERT
jgi:hypothetical protein